jgi:hypothetical protein
MGDRPRNPSRVRTSEDKVRRKDLYGSVKVVYVLEKLPDVSGPDLVQAGCYSWARHRARGRHEHCGPLCPVARHDTIQGPQCRAWAMTWARWHTTARHDSIAVPDSVMPCRAVPNHARAGPLSGRLFGHISSTVQKGQ